MNNLTGRLSAVGGLHGEIVLDVYTKPEADAKFADKDDVYTKVQADEKFADKNNVYTKEETNELLDDKADKATTLAGYGITDAYTKSETNSLLDEKADKSDTYTKQETNSLLDEKADKSTTYTKTEVDSALSLKANSTDVYTKTEADGLLSAKANKATTLAGYGITDAYTKTETDNLLNGKADADDVYTKSEIDTKIPSSVGSATKPVYVNGGVVSACTYELNKTVPANAVFTDTTYSAGNGLNLSGTSFSAKAGTNVTVNTSGINVNGNGAVASADSGLISGGTAYTELRPTLDGTWVKNAQTTAINLQKLEGGIEYLYAILSKQYDQLKKYINGNYYDYDTDTDSKYTKTVLAGAMPYASLDSIGGKTLVWNQLVNPSSIVNRGTIPSVGLSLTTAGNGEITINGTSTQANNLYFVSSFSFIAGHTYLLACDKYGNGSDWWIRAENLFTTQNGASMVTTVAAATRQLQLVFDNNVTFNNVTIHPQIFDLTLMFGSGNESTTVSEFQQMFPAQYYPYNAGTLLSAGVTEVVSKGKNLADFSGGAGVPSDTALANTTKRIFEIGKYVAGLASNNYYYNDNVANVSVTDNSISFSCVAGGYGVGIPFNCVGGVSYTRTMTRDTSATNFVVAWYDINGNYISNSFAITSTAPANATQGVLVLLITSVNTIKTFTDIQVEASATATTYSPYQEHTYPIPASIQALEGYGWSAGSVYNYIDYERKVFVQRVGSVDLGSLNWNVNSDRFTTTSALSPSPISGNWSVSNKVIVCSKYAIAIVNAGNGVDKAIGMNAKLLYARDTNYATASDFKTAMSDENVKLYYELATPVETDISEYLADDNLISVEAGGTLTFPNSNGDDYRIPVPSAETYMVDLQEAI